MVSLSSFNLFLFAPNELDRIEQRRSYREQIRLFELVKYPKQPNHIKSLPNNEM